MSSYPFQNAFTNFENNKSQLTGHSQVNPNAMNFQVAPVPKGPAIPPMSGGNPSAIPFGSYGSGATAPSGGAAGGTQPSGVMPMISSKPDVPSGGDYAGAAPAGGGMFMARGGSVPGFYDGGSNDGSQDSQDNSDQQDTAPQSDSQPSLGDYAGNSDQQEQPLTPSAGDYSGGNMDDALSTVMDVLDQGRQNISGGGQQMAENDKLPLEPASTGRMPGNQGSWSGPRSRPGPAGQAAPPLQISPSSGSTNGQWGKKQASLGDFKDGIKTPLPDDPEYADWRRQQQHQQLQPSGGLPVPVASNGSFGGDTQFMARGGAVGTKAYEAGGYVSGDTGNGDPAQQGADNTPGDGAIPGDASAGGDTTGPDPSTTGQASDDQLQSQSPDPQALMSYASGADAVSPDVAQAAEQQVDPHQTMTPQERAMQAIAQAAKQGDHQKAWGLMQHNRKSYNVKRHSARAALAMGNKREAVRLANSAMQHVPNGTHVQFTPHAHGVHVAFHNIAKAKRA